MKKKKIASNIKDIVFSEIDLKETTFKNNDVVYYSLDVVSDNSSNNSDKSLNLDDYDLNIDDFNINNNQPEIKNISLDNNYNVKNIEENIDNISTNKLLNEVERESLNKIENESMNDINLININNINNTTDTSRIKLNTNEFFNILNNQHKNNQDNIDQNQDNIEQDNIEQDNIDQNQDNIEQDNIDQNQDNIDQNQDNIDQNQDNIEQDNIDQNQDNIDQDNQNQDNIDQDNIDQNQDNIDQNNQNQNNQNQDNQNQDNQNQDNQNQDNIDQDNIDQDNIDQNNIDKKNITESDKISELNNEIKLNKLDQKIENLQDIETKDKLNIWRDLIDSKENLYSSYNYLQTETQSNNLVDLINKNVLFKFYKLAEDNKKNISGYIDGKQILNCKHNTTYKYEVHTKITNVYIDPPGNYINILFNKDLDIIKCIFLLNNNGYWTMEPMENFLIFKNDINKQKILLTYFIILKILFCNKYYPFNEGNSIQKYRNLTKNINLNIINHIKKNNKFEDYINEQLKNVYKQEYTIDSILNIININNINKYYGRIIKLKYKYY